MILRPQSAETFKNFHEIHSTQNTNSTEFRKKIQNFSFFPFDKIGRGYSSIVYKGQNDITKQSVAIKVIELKSLRDQNTKRFLQNQLQCLRKLNHENNLRYINSFITSNNCYIITELYSEGDLGKILKQKIRFSQLQAFEIFNQFYQGYIHFNSKGYIHRDIKPSNVLINKKKSRAIYVIADFGFVKKLQQQPKDSFSVGTPVYMSPQSITSNIYTTKSDIWSMGVMLFELVYGFLPFQSKSQTDLKRQICNKQLKLQEIQQINRIQTTPQFKSLLLKCLRKNPQNRISLHQIKDHPWFSKKLNNYHNQFSFRYQNVQTEPNQRKEKISISKDSNTNLQKQFGYIGNQAIKREKSIQGSNAYSLKNYFKNPQRKLIIKNYDSFAKQNQAQHLSAQKQNISYNIRMIKQKFNQINLSVEKQNEKAKTLGILSTDNYRNQGSLSHKISKQQTAGYLTLKSKDMNQSLNMNDFHNQSLRNINSYQKSNLFSPVLLKNSLTVPNQQSSKRSSLLQGMKGVVNLKNNQISKIKFEQQNTLVNRGSLIKKQSIHTKQKEATIQQYSTSLDESTQKNNSICLQQVCLNQIFPETKSAQIQKINKRYNSKRIQQICNKNKRQQQQEKTSKPKFIAANQLIVKSIHILRYIFQTISLPNNSTQDKYKEVRQILAAFFTMYLLKLKTCLLQKQNIFNLENWAEFVEFQKFQAFKEVIRQYYERYSINPKIKDCLNQYYFDWKHIQTLNINKFQKANVYILKQVQEMTNLYQEINKKSIRNNSINAQIILIYNYHKCLEIIIKVLKSQNSERISQKNSNDFLMELTPQKDLQELTTKNKDPFRIPKILIQLKKKIINLQSNYPSTLDYSQKQYKIQIIQ